MDSYQAPNDPSPKISTISKPFHWPSPNVRPHNHGGVAHLDTLDVHAVRDPSLHHSLGAEVCPLDASLWFSMGEQNNIDNRINSNSINNNNNNSKNYNKKTTNKQRQQQQQQQ